MNRHWVVIAEWCVDYQGGLTVVGVYHTPEDAHDAFMNRVESDDRILAEEYKYDIFEDTNTVFDSGKKGYYSQDHICVRIEEVTEEKTV